MVTRIPPGSFVGQYAVTRLLHLTLGPTPVSRGGYRTGGSSKQKGIETDRQLDEFCAHGTEPTQKEALAILNKMRAEGVSLISTQKRYELILDKHLIIGIIDGIGLKKNGEKVVLEWKTGYRRSLSRSSALPPYLLSGGVRGNNRLNDNQRSRALIQLVSYCALSGCDRGLLLVASGNRCTSKWIRGGCLEGVPGIDILRRLVEHCPSE